MRYNRKKILISPLLPNWTSLLVRYIYFSTLKSNEMCYIELDIGTVLVYQGLTVASCTCKQQNKRTRPIMLQFFNELICALCILVLDLDHWTFSKLLHL